MKNLLIAVVFFVTTVLVAQEQVVSDQNPNSNLSYQKYLKVADQYIAKQGTTDDKTYVAIDPIEEKRIRTKIRKDYRAQRALWRHKERMEQAKNTRYISRATYGGLGYYSGIGFRNFNLGFSNHGVFRSGLGCTYNLR